MKVEGDGEQKPARDNLEERGVMVSPYLIEQANKKGAAVK
jgi:hypothetical protein